MEVEIRFKFDITDDEQARFDDLQHRSDRNHQQYAKALLIAMINAPAGIVRADDIGNVRTRRGDS